MKLPEDFGRTFITLHSKKKLYLASFKPEELVITDIAHGLSQMCRYGCQGRFYSVAQHCVIMSHMVSKENAFWALMHDAAEAYVGDMVQPLKQLLPDFKEIEKWVFDKVKLAFNLKGEEPEEVKLWDLKILYEEAKVVMGIDAEKEGWNLPPNPNMPKIRPWPKKKAKELFLQRFNELYIPA
jgi:hypothetical protein